MPLGIGIWELLVLLGALLLVFGPRRLPDMGRSLGSGIRDLRDGVIGDRARDTEGFPSELESMR